MRDAERAKTLLAGGATLALVRGEREIVGEERGIKQLFALCERGEGRGFAAADKIVGKAAALLYVLLGVHTVFAEVMGEDGIYTLARHGITPLCDTSVKEIRNRTDAGVCPMEETVKEITDPKEGLYALKKRLEQMITKHEQQESNRTETEVRAYGISNGTPRIFARRICVGKAKMGVAPVHP